MYYMTFNLIIITKSHEVRESNQVRIKFGGCPVEICIVSVLHKWSGRGIFFHNLGILGS